MANSADPDQTAPRVAVCCSYRSSLSKLLEEQSDQVLHCLSFHQHLLESGLSLSFRVFLSKLLGVRIYRYFTLYESCHDKSYLWRFRLSVLAARSATNMAVKLQKMARGLEFQIEVVEGLNYL